MFYFRVRYSLRYTSKMDAPICLVGERGVHVTDLYLFTYTDIQPYFHITWSLYRVTWRVPLVEQELLISEHRILAQGLGASEICFYYIIQQGKELTCLHFYRWSC